AGTGTRTGTRTGTGARTGTGTGTALRLRAHVGEQEHVADGGDAGEGHDQAVDADAEAAGGGHAVLQGADVVGVVVHGLDVTGVLGGDLSAEPGGLVLG